MATNGSGDSRWKSLIDKFNIYDDFQWNLIGPDSYINHSFRWKMIWTSEAGNQLMGATELAGVPVGESVCMKNENLGELLDLITFWIIAD